MKNKKPIYIFLHLPKTGGGSLNRNLRKKFSKKEILGLAGAKDLNKVNKNKLKYIHSHNVPYGIHNEFTGREARYIIFMRDPAERRVSQYNHDIYRMDSKKKPSFKKWYKSQIKNEQVFLLSKKFKGISGRKVSTKLDPFLNAIKIANSGFKRILGFRILKFFLSFKRNEKEEYENAKKLLDKCWFVGITERLNKDLPKIFEVLGLDSDWEMYRTAKKKGSKISKSKNEVIKVFELDEKTREKIYEDNQLELKLYKYAKKLNLEKEKNLNQ